MRILFLAPANSVHTVKWVNELINKGCEIILVSLPDHRNHSGINEDVRCIYLPFSGIKGYYLNAVALHTIYKKIKPDIVNVHYASGYGTLARVARLHPVILSVWGSDVYSFPYKNKINMCIIKKNIKYADKIASTSYCMAEQVNNLMNCDMHCTITPFGVDVEKFCKISDGIKGKQDKYIFGNVKSLEDVYGIDDLLKAFALFFQDKNVGKNSVELHIYGKGSKEKYLKKLACDLGIEDNTFFKGVVTNDRVSYILNGMSAFVCTSAVRESFGVAVVEAMSCELPVIVTATEGFKEIVQSKKYGIIVPVHNIRRIAYAMSYLYKHRNFGLKMGKAGREHVVKNFEWHKNVDTMLDLYKDVMRK